MNQEHNEEAPLSEEEILMQRIELEQQTDKALREREELLKRISELEKEIKTSKMQPWIEKAGRAAKDGRWEEAAAFLITIKELDDQGKFDE